MAFIIPNAVDTVPGNKYSVLDQAEPDSIDFEILGNNNSGVINGCEVTPTPVAGGSVAVSAGTVVINGSMYSVPAVPYLVLANAPISGNRFDMVVARKNTVTNTVSFVALYGIESTTNPTLPKSKTVLLSTVGLDAYSYFNADTDVAVASIYRLGSTVVTDAYIVDKRKNIQGSITYRSVSAPQNNTGQVGDFYLNTGDLGRGESGVFVKRSSSEWVQLANAAIDPGVPIGSVITWVSPVTTPNNTVWIECNGATVSRATYPELFAVLGTSYGAGDGSTTFTLPDFRGMFLAGLPAVGGALATPTGNIDHQVQLSSENLPAHTHSINHSHTGTTTVAGNHTHSAGVQSTEFAVRLSAMPQSGHIALYQSAPGNFTRGSFRNPVGYADGYHVSPTWARTSHPQAMPLVSTSNTAEAGQHSHTVNIPTTQSLVSGTTGSNDPDSVNIQPRTMYVKYYIRYI